MTAGRPKITIAVPDLVSPSYFPAIAAVRLGICEQFGVDAHLEHLFPVTRAVAELAAGKVDFLAGAAHCPRYLPDPGAVRVVAALSQGAYWFLVVRADLDGELGGLATTDPLRIGAAPGVDVALREILAQLGLQVARQFELVAIPLQTQGETSFGVGAAAALATGRIDGFWANGMAAELAVRHGFGRVILDARRDQRFHDLTFAALLCSARTGEDRPGLVAQVTAALRETQRLLTERPALASEAVEGMFPAQEQSLIADLIARDAPFYDSAIGAVTLPVSSSST